MSSIPIAWADGGVGGGTAASIATGVNGNAFSAAVQVGDIIEVTCVATSISVSSAASVTDTLGNSYGSAAYHLSDLPHSAEIYKFVAVATVAGTPVVTFTYGATAVIGISCISIRSVNPSTPYNAGNVVGAFFTAGASPSANSLSSGNTPTLSVVPAIVIGFGWTVENFGPPTAVGTGFTAFGSAMLNLGFASSAIYEYKNVSSTTAVAATFTPLASHDAYSIVSVYNDNNTTNTATIAWTV
jgi:hypothetical protein